MKFISLLAPLLLIASSVKAQTGDYSTCPTFALITSRGCCDSRLNSSWIGPMANAVLEQLDGGIHYETDYDSDFDMGIFSFITDIFVLPNLYAGAWVLSNYTTTLAEKCPDTKIAMHGYSMGSIVQVLAQNNPPFPRNRITANTLWGNFFWRAGQPENAGTATSGTGMFGMFGFNPIHTPSEIVPVTQDYCLTGDMICTLAFGDPESHHHYNIPPWVDTTVDYLVSTLKKAGVPANPNAPQNPNIPVIIQAANATAVPAPIASKVIANSVQKSSTPKHHHKSTTSKNTTQVHHQRMEKRASSVKQD